MVETTSLDLLRDARFDIRVLDWAQPSNREAVRIFHEIERAKKEVVRLVVKFRLLLTATVDEHMDFSVATSYLADQTRHYHGNPTSP